MKVEFKQHLYGSALIAFFTGQDLTLLIRVFLEFNSNHKKSFPLANMIVITDLKPQEKKNESVNKFQIISLITVI